MAIICWTLLSEYGFGYVWQTSADGINQSLFIKQFEQKVNGEFQHRCFSDITESHKCILYTSLEREFYIPSYLLKVHIQSNRMAMFKNEHYDR